MGLQWEPCGERCLPLAHSLALIHFQVAGERAEGGAALAVVYESQELGPTARSTGLRYVHEENDDITATQEAQGATGAAGGVARGETHGDSAGDSRVGRKPAPRGECD